jgi:hypothetical protein
MLSRGAKDIVTRAMRRGRLLIFHPTSLHGGGPTPAGMTRRRQSLRMLGDDVAPSPAPLPPTANNIGDEEEELVGRIAASSGSISRMPARRI